MNDKKIRKGRQDKLQVDQKVKKCPYCSSYMQLDATHCPDCKRKVGRVDHLGKAKKPVDWKAYLSALIALGAFIAFLWWVFNR